MNSMVKRVIKPHTTAFVHEYVDLCNTMPITTHPFVFSDIAIHVFHQIRTCIQFVPYAFFDARVRLQLFLYPTVKSYMVRGVDT